MRIKKAQYLYILLLISLTLMLACSSEKKDIINSFEEAINSQDVDLVLSFYDREVSIVMNGVGNVLFHDEMRPLAEWDAAMNAQVHFRIVDTRGDTVICIKEEQSDWFRLFDIDTVYFDPWNFVIENGKITGMVSQLTGKSATAMQYGMKSFTNWASVKYPKELEALMPEGEFVYGTDAANRWLDLVREWRETVEKNR